MTGSNTQEVKPTFSDIVELVRREYRDGFGIEVGYAKAAKLVDEAIKPQLGNQYSTKCLGCGASTSYCENCKRLLQS